MQNQTGHHTFGLSGNSTPDRRTPPDHPTTLTKIRSQIDCQDRRYTPSPHHAINHRAMLTNRSLPFVADMLKSVGTYGW
jgi:hypothetical protein